MLSSLIFSQMGITQVGVRTRILDAIREVHKKEWDVTSLQATEKHSVRWGSCLPYLICPDQTAHDS